MMKPGLEETVCPVGSEASCEYSTDRVLGRHTQNVQNKVRAYLGRYQRGSLQVGNEPKGETSRMQVRGRSGVRMAQPTEVLSQWEVSKTIGRGENIFVLCLK